MYLDAPNRGWRADRKLAGGGCILDNGYHIVDLIIWYFGLPDMVYANSSAKAVPNPKYDTEDTAAIQFSYKKGLYGTLFLSCRYAPTVEFTRLTGSNGFCELGKDNAKLCDPMGGVIRELVGNYDKVDLVAEQLCHFSKMVSGEEEEISNINYNMQHMIFIESCYRSIEKGKQIETARVSSSLE